jgi:hypothetical protein
MAAATPSYPSTWLPVILSLPLMGAGANGILAISSTYNFVIATIPPAIITSIEANAITPPTVASSVTVQFFKSGTTNAITGVYDLNSLTAGVGASIPITGNQTLSSTDFIVCQVVTGGALNSAAGLNVTVGTRNAAQRY